MKRVALHVHPRDGGIDEAEVEAGVVPDQHRAFAAIGLEGLAHAAKDVVHRGFFADCHAQRVIELDAGELQRRRFDVGTFERFYAEEIGVFREHEAFFIHADSHRSDFQQGIGG